MVDFIINPKAIVVRLTTSFFPTPYDYMPVFAFLGLLCILVTLYSRSRCGYPLATHLSHRIILANLWHILHISIALLAYLITLVLIVSESNKAKLSCQ
jgi:hypothetical protein